LKYQMIIINYDYLFKLFIRCSLNHDDYMVYYIYLYLQSTVLNNVSSSKTRSVGEQYRRPYLS
jgi:hypothetical protein